MRDLYFDVTAKDAVDVILSDSKKEKDARKTRNSYVDYAAMSRCVLALMTGFNMVDLIKRPSVRRSNNNERGKKSISGQDLKYKGSKQ